MERCPVFRSTCRYVRPGVGSIPGAGRFLGLVEHVLCRLRVGHTYGTHGYLLRGEERPFCSRCNEPVTVAHVLLACRHYARKRRVHLGRIPPTVTLKHLLGDDSPWVQNGSIFSFIRDIDFPVVYPLS